MTLRWRQLRAESVERLTAAGMGEPEREVGWIIEDNLPMRRIIEAAGGHVRKTYRIYEKALA